MLLLPAKVLVKYAKDSEKIEIVGGTMESTILDENGVKSLAALPGLDELRGKIVGLLQAPAGKLASVTQAPAGQLGSRIRCLWIARLRRPRFRLIINILN